MLFPNWFKYIWWVTLIVAISIYFAGRYKLLLMGESTAVDIVVFIGWIALCLMPLFQEIDIWGFKVKKEMDSLKEDIDNKINRLETTIKNTLNFNPQFNPQINLATLPSDADLPELKKQVHEAVEIALQEYKIEPTEGQAQTPSVDKDVASLFVARYNLEKELRRINNLAYAVPPDGTQPLRTLLSIRSLIDRLVRIEMIVPGLAAAINDVYSICSQAVHGQSVTPKQIAFVNEVSPEIFSVLFGIREKLLSRRGGPAVS